MLSVTVCTIGYVYLFVGTFMDFVCFLSMIIYEVLYTYMMFKVIFAAPGF